MLHMAFHIAPSKTILITVSRQQRSICVQMWDNLADILQKLAAKKPVAMRC